MKKLQVLILLFLLTQLSTSQAITIKDKVGTSGAQFLKLGVGARAAGVGGAFSGVANDALSVFWNPAGLGYVEKKSLNVSHLSWIADINHESFAYAQNFSDVGVMAISFITLGTEEIEITTPQMQEGTGQTYSYRDIAIGLSYARRLTYKFSFGMTIKYLDEQIYAKHARGIAFDVGTQYQTGLGSLVLSMAMTNFGQDLNFDGNYFNTEVVSGTNTMLFERRKFQSYALPLKFVIGVAYDIINSDLFKSKIAADAIHPNDYSERVHFGSENWFKDTLAFRLGYKFNYDEEGLCLGFGVRKRIRNFDLSFDYAYSDLGVFKNVDYFSFSIIF